MQKSVLKDATKKSKIVFKEQVFPNTSRAARDLLVTLHYRLVFIIRDNVFIKSPLFVDTLNCLEIFI